MDFIKVKGARQNNLKNISVQIPKGKIVVLTGPSGSGKSSLVFDTIYAEAYRRYIESISIHKRWLIEQMERPDVDIIEGLPPSICIRQWGFQKNPRSTVGTITEIYDYLRLLFSKIGRPYCPNCGIEIPYYTVQEMVERIISLGDKKRIKILSPLKIEESVSKLIKKLRKDGFIRIRIDGKELSIDEEIHLDEGIKKVEVVVDRVVLKEGIRKRLTESIELALSLSKGAVIIDVIGEKEIFFSKNPICHICNFQIPDISPQLFSFNNPKGACPLCNGIGIYKEDICPECNGRRLKKISDCVKIEGRSISELSSMPISKLKTFFDKICFRLSKREILIADQILNEIKKRINLILEIGLSYLSIDRSVNTLSGGEEQRIRLVKQLSSEMSGILYILDEPTIGLHPLENERLLKTINRLKDLGNTILIVEHDPEIIKKSDFIIEIGPGSGENGGRIVFEGNFKDLLRSDTLTGRYLSKKKNASRKRRRRGSGRFLIIKGAKEHNLKDIDVKIPLQAITCLTGISGSGKSTLLRDIIYPALLNKIYKRRIKPGKFDEILGAENINRVIYVDQSPIGKSPKSNPATYTGVFSYIRKLFSLLPESRERGYKPSRFSLNVEGGRCEICKGDGVIRVEMDFLPDVYITCDACNGKRFTKDVLEIKYKGMSISDILDMTAEKAYIFFENIPPIRNRLKIFLDIGLGYIKLGQPANTLSGGEAQRLKLIRELGKRSRGDTLYLLDEPTIGLHQAEVEKLLNVLNQLVDKGNSIIIIEHNLDLISACDYIIDLGPEGGEDGGYIVATGTPDEIANSDNSYTGKFLKKRGCHE